MASAPFTLNISTPANTDIAANYPSLDRTDKDVIQSWLLVQMNDYGHDNFTLIDQVGSAHGPGSAPTPSTGTIAVYYDEDTQLKQYSGDVGSVEIVGVPAGTVLDFAGPSAPVGYILLTGGQGSPQNVSRTTYARLFAVIGTHWGNGDGSTTFGLPPADSFYIGPANATSGGYADYGGSFTATITQGNLPNVNLDLTSLSITNGTNISSSPSNEIVNISQGAGNPKNGYQPGYPFTVNLSLGGTLSLGGSGTPLSIAPPFAVLNKIIKY